MPLYQFWCDGCFTPYEVTMTLADLDKFDRDKTKKMCPGCGKKLVKLICPPKRIKIN